ncbi:MAG: hypothetical protein AAF546_03205 [Verrucomicrobiota bacterium]
MDTVKDVMLEMFDSIQKHYACFALASGGMESNRKVLKGSPPEAHAFFSDRDPREGGVTAALKIKDLLRYSKKGGEFQDTLAKSTVVVIYSEWEEFFRPRIARIHGVSLGGVESPLMGDIRRVRNCIVHDRSVLAEKHTKLDVLDWHLKVGKLVIDQGMLKRVIEQIREIKIGINTQKA